MKVLIALALAFAIVMTFEPLAARADDGDAPVPPPRFRPWQQVWQCNDIRVTVTARLPEEIEYDLGGSICGGSRFNVIRGYVYFNGRPCAPLQPIAGY